MFPPVQLLTFTYLHRLFPFSPFFHFLPARGPPLENVTAAILSYAVSHLHEGTGKLRRTCNNTVSHLTESVLSLQSLKKWPLAQRFDMQAADRRWPIQVLTQRQAAWLVWPPGTGHLPHTERFRWYFLYYSQFRTLFVHKIFVKNTKMPLNPWFTERSVKFHEKFFSVPITLNEGCKEDEEIEILAFEIEKHISTIGISKLRKLMHSISRCLCIVHIRICVRSPLFSFSFSVRNRPRLLENQRKHSSLFQTDFYRFVKGRC